MENKHRHIINILTAGIFAVILFTFALVIIIKPDESFSTEERRSLSSFPEMTLDSFISGDFGDEFNVYLNDQFPLRDGFVGLKALAELASLKRENKGVLFGANGQLAVRLFEAYGFNGTEVELYSSDNVKTQLDAVKILSQKLEEKDIELSVILPPRTIDVAVSAFDYPSDFSDMLISEIRDYLSGSVNFVDMYDIYRARYDNREYVYYRTDHHWTTLGAYYAYAEIMKSFGETYHAIADFEIHTAVDDFLGTTYSKSGLKSASSDTIEYWTLKNDASEYTMEIHKGKTKNIEKTFDSFYDESYLDSYDQYSFFLSGTNALTEIYKKGESDRETLLVLKDSFAHSLIPFLALHYDLIVVNLVDLYDVYTTCGAFDVDKVLICYNLENLITSTGLTKVANAYKLVK